MQLVHFIHCHCTVCAPWDYYSTHLLHQLSIYCINSTLIMNVQQRLQVILFYYGVISVYLSKMSLELVSIRLSVCAPSGQVDTVSPCFSAGNISQ